MKHPVAPTHYSDLYLNQPVVQVVCLFCVCVSAYLSVCLFVCSLSSRKSVEYIDDNGCHIKEDSRDFEDYEGDYDFNFQEYDASEVNLDQIYESLDKQIDEDVLKQRKAGKKVAKKTTSKKKKKEEVEVKEEEEFIAEVKKEPP